MNRWTPLIDQTSAGFAQSFGHLNEQQLNWKPNAETWSIAQNIHHLITVNETYYPVLKALHEGAYALPFVGRLGFMVSFFGKMILGSVQPDRKRKIKTFPIWEPAQSHLPADILALFLRHQDELKAQIEGAAALVSGGAVVASPANSVIVYKLETAFDIIVAHEQRHLEQAREVLAMLPGVA